MCWRILISVRYVPLMAAVQALPEDVERGVESPSQGRDIPDSHRQSRYIALTTSVAWYTSGQCYTRVYREVSVGKQ